MGPLKLAALTQSNAATTNRWPPNVGIPVVGIQVKLEAWLEGNYTPDDEPNLGSEIMIGRKIATNECFNMRPQTEDAFSVGPMARGGGSLVLDRR